MVKLLLVACVTLVLSYLSLAQDAAGQPGSSRAITLERGQGRAYGISNTFLLSGEKIELRFLADYYFSEGYIDVGEGKWSFLAVGVGGNDSTTYGGTDLTLEFAPTRCVRKLQSNWNDTLTIHCPLRFLRFEIRSNAKKALLIVTDLASPRTATALPPTATAHPPTATPLPPTATPLPPTATPLPPTATPLPPTPTPLPPTATLLPPTATLLPPTATPLPPTATPLPPTATPLPATATLLPPTATPLPPTATAVPPTATAVPPTATAVPPSATAVPPTATAVPPTATTIPPTTTPIKPTATMQADRVRGARPIDIPPPSLFFDVARFDAPIYGVALDQAQLRQGPGEEYVVSNTLEVGSALLLTGQVDDWYESVDDGKLVYVETSSVQLSEVAQSPSRPPTESAVVAASAPTPAYTLFTAPLTRYTRSAMNLREGPGTSYRRVGVVPEGARLEVVGQSGDWYVIEFNGREAYIASWLTYDSPPAEPAAERPPEPNQRTMPQQAAPTRELPVRQPNQSIEPRYSCGARKTCSQLSCDEAYFQLNNCGNKRLDNDGDGVPCESVCPGG